MRFNEALPHLMYLLLLCHLIHCLHWRGGAVCLAGDGVFVVGQSWCVVFLGFFECV